MTYFDIVRYYQYFYSKVYHYKDFIYSPNSRDKKVIENFISKIDNSSIGEDWLYNYFSFQFKYWSELKYKRFKGVVISYILGNKAIERFNDRPEEWYYLINQLTFDFKLSRSDLYSNNIYKKDLLIISLSEEQEKQRFNNLERLANCILSTTLYNSKSKICILCSQAKTCKELLKDRYPLIFKARYEENIK